MYYDWSDDYLVGVGSVDEQHQRLFMMVGVLEKYLQRNEPELVIENFFMELLKYTKSHFDSEEALMKKNEVPDWYFAIQTEAHEKLKKDLGEIYDRLKKEGKIFYPALTRFLLDWLRNHIVKTDIKLAGFVNDQNEI